MGDFFSGNALLTFAGCDELIRILRPSEGTAEILLFDDLSAITLDADVASITKISIEGDLLQLMVTYSGGCENHTFKLYGSRNFAESLPPQVNLFLSHNANGDVCEALMGEDLVFDFSPLKKAYRNAYQDDGPVVLRIHEPGASEPVEPLPQYTF